MLNSVNLIGRLTADPELKQTQSGVPYTTFVLACERDIADKQSGERQTDFPSLIAWRGTAEFICKYFTKGRMMAVSGRLETSNYTDKDGNNRYKTQILVSDAYFAGDKPQNGANAPQTQQAPQGGYDYSQGQQAPAYPQGQQKQGYQGQQKQSYMQGQQSQGYVQAQQPAYPQGYGYPQGQQAAPQVQAPVQNGNQRNQQQAQRQGGFVYTPGNTPF